MRLAGLEYVPEVLLRTNNGIETWRGVRRDDDHGVIIKVARSRSLSSQQLELLLREAEALQDLKSMFFAPLLAYGRYEDGFALVMGFIPGETLEERVRHRPVPWKEALEVGHQLSLALEELHHLGYIHGDLKPAHVILSDTGPVLCDFGLSYRLTVQMTEPLGGTVYFSAPEQMGLIQGALSPAADLYSLGRLLCWSLDPAVIDDDTVMSSDFRMPTSKDVPALFSRILERLVETAPDERYASACGLSYDLRQAILDPNQEFVLGRRDVRSSLVESSFVGRVDELAQLRAGVDGGSLVLLSGYSGMGKSRLLRAFGEMCQREGMVVFEGQATARQGEISLPIWDRLMQKIVAWLNPRPELQEFVRCEVDEYGAVLVLAFPCLETLFGAGQADSDYGLESVLEGLVLFLRALSQSQRILLLFDDVQWADPFTLKFLSVSPVGTVAAFRTEEVDGSHPLADLEVSTISLAPLSGDLVKSLLESMAGPLPREAVEEIRRLAGGEPFLLQSYLRGAVELGMLQPSPKGWRWESTALPVSSDTRSAWRLSERLESLTPKDRGLLAVGALLGKEFSPSLLAQLVKASEVEVQSSLGFLSNRGLVRFVEERACFTHDKIREALEGDFTKAQKHELHSQAALWLETQSDATPRELASHWWEANDRARALPYAVSAARQAEERLDYPEASSFYRMALEVSVDLLPPELHRELLKGLALSLSLSDDYQRAKDVFREAIDAYRDDTKERAYLLAGLAEQLSRLNEYQSANQAATEALSLLGAPQSHHRVHIFAQILAMLAGLAWKSLRNQSKAPSICELKRAEVCEAQVESSVRTMRFDIFAWCLLRGLLDLGDSSPRPQGARLRMYASQIAAVLDLRTVSHRLRSDAIQGGKLKPRVRAHVTGQSGYGLMIEADVRGALAQFEEAMPLCRYCNDMWNLAVNQHHAALSNYFLGRLDRARKLALSVLSRKQQGDASNSIAAARILALLGAGEEHLPSIDRYEEEMRETAFCGLGYLAKGLVELQRAVWSEAVGFLKQASAKHSAFLGPHTAGCSSWLALAYRCWAEDLPVEALSHRRALLREAARAVQTALRHTARFLVNQPHALREHAISSAYAGRFYLARAQFEKSLEISERLGMEFETAWTLYERGRFSEVAGWPDWSGDQAEGLSRVRRLGGWIPGVDLSVPEPQRHLAKLDRFDRVLEAGRRLVLLTQEEQLLKALQEEAKSLLRCDKVRLVRPGELPGHLSKTLYERCLTERRAVTEAEVEEPTRSLLLGEARSTLMAPVEVNGEHYAMLVVKQKSLGGFFGEEEMRLADYLCALAGAGLENAQIVAQREQTFQALQTSEERFRGFFEYAGVGTALLDETGVLIEENPYLTSLLGGSNLGKTLWQLTHASDREALKGSFTVLRQGKIQRYDAELRLHRAGGEVAWSQSCLVPLPVHQGEKSRYLLTVADTTHRRIAEMLEFLENERRALAAEVHDELAQNLSALHMRLAGLRSEEPKIQAATLLAHQLVEDTTALMMSLRNPLAEGVDLVPALKSLVSSFSVECEAEMEVDWPEEPLALSDLSSLVLYRVLQEGLTNIRKHASASFVKLEFSQTEGHLEVRLSDNGKGFDPEEWLGRKAAQKHFGLLSMRDRVELVGGGLEISSAPDQGVSLTVALPLL